jgi:hypothetical protein
MNAEEHVLVIPRWVAEWAREDLGRDLLPSDCPPYGYWDRIEIAETKTRPPTPSTWQTLQQAVDQAELPLSGLRSRPSSPGVR